jgi:hypothetical protein
VWTLSPYGWFKLNFDGSVYNDGNGRASIGGVIHDSTNRVVLSSTKKTDHSMVGIIEARAGPWPVAHMGLSLDKIVVQGDGLVLV